MDLLEAFERLGAMANDQTANGLTDTTGLIIATSDADFREACASALRDARHREQHDAHLLGDGVLMAIAIRGGYVEVLADFIRMAKWYA